MMIRWIEGDPACQIPPFPRRILALAVFAFLALAIFAFLALATFAGEFPLSHSLCTMDD